ncbi:hypothetical protein [Piscinibacter sp.]|uniref:hypothetical protein n=1 Tax=Piscinibacter sp. TaxID=1903157 RepID=UPI003784BE31
MAEEEGQHDVGDIAAQAGSLARQRQQGPAAPRAVDPLAELAVRAAQVAELVRDHRTELARRQAHHQRQAEHEVVAVPAQQAQARLLPHRGVELACDQGADVAAGHGALAHLLDQLEEAWRLLCRHRQPLRRFEAHPQRAQQREQQRGAAQHQHHFPARQSTVQQLPRAPHQAPGGRGERRQDGRIAEGRHRGGAAREAGRIVAAVVLVGRDQAAEERVVHRAVLSTRHLDARAMRSLCHAPAALS